MNAKPLYPSEGHRPSQALSGLRRLPAGVGAYTMGLWQGLIRFVSDAAAVIRQSCRPVTWRRSVRTEFMRQCFQVGAQALPFILVSGIFLGFGLVAQLLHWLKVFGSTALFSGFIPAILIREIAPVLVGLIVIGRSGSTLLFELGTMNTEGQVDMLDAQGIDPFLYLVLPRVLAFSVCMFSLSVAFVALALIAGFFSGILVELPNFTFTDFLYRAIGSVGLQTYILFSLKTVTIGFVVALILCKMALSLTGSAATVLDTIPRGFAKSALATLIISIAISILFK